MRLFYTAEAPRADFKLSASLAKVLWIVAFALLTGIGAQVEIPHYPIPFTLQTFFVLLAGGMLGQRNGALSQLLYLMMGIAGLPVFSGFHAGLFHLLGPTGGYLLSFPIAAAVIGILMGRTPSLLRCFGAMTAGLFIIFTLGTVYLNVTYLHNWADSIRNGFLIFSWWDVVKLSGAAVISSRTARLTNSLK